MHFVFSLQSEFYLRLEVLSQWERNSLLHSRERMNPTVGALLAFLISQKNSGEWAKNRGVLEEVIFCPRADRVLFAAQRAAIFRQAAKPPALGSFPEISFL